MTSRDSMNEYISSAVKRYSSLFKLPSRKTVLVELFVACLFAGILIATALRFSQLYLFALGSSLGTTIFALVLVSDFLIQLNSLKTDPVFNMRRCLALSLYSLLIWNALILAGVIANLFYHGVWFKFFVLGFCAALALRLIVLTAVSFANIIKVAVFASLLPALYTVTVVYTAFAANALALDPPLLAFLVLSTAVTIVAVFAYMFSIHLVGKEILGVGSFSLLRAFMATWTEDESAPFERLFERYSQERNIQLAALSFRNARGTVKATMIVPAFHPGPFKNVGSSALPHAIQSTLENKLGDCVVLVPHGLSGHDSDLANQAQNQLVLERALKLGEVSNFGVGATPFFRLKRDGASVGCQVFNGCALVALTLAPQTMEDLPPELNTLIIEAAKKNGLLTAIAVDAHNSIQGPFKIDEAIEPLQEAALAILEKASKQKPTGFQVGAARVVPREFGLREGIGPGGIAVLVVRVDGQTTAYVTIDGNNMITGLREKILSVLSEVGVNDGEVFTTDTHEVNAVVLNARGYHPVGEAMNQESLVKYVKQATLEALSNLEPAEAAWRTDTVSGVRVIGEKQIEAMCTLLDKAMRRAKKMAVLVFPIAGVVLAALLLLL